MCRDVPAPTALVAKEPVETQKLWLRGSGKDTALWEFMSPQLVSCRLSFLYLSNTNSSRTNLKTEGGKFQNLEKA